jgi:DNA-binding transcriptional ArsR family regulator/predicted nucleotidyltransferase
MVIPYFCQLSRRARVSEAPSSKPTGSVRIIRIILRMLRRSPLLDVLVSKTKQRILAATLLQPGRSWYLLELSRHLGLRPSSLQRELKQLTEAGVLKRQQSRNRVYQADTACPVFPELAQVLFKTVGVFEALQKALEPVQNQIDVAFIYGSVAASSERSTSDIDLMVIGLTPLSKIAPLLRDLERQVGRPINPTVYGRSEFMKRVHGENHFLKSVLRSDPLFIKGGPDELAKLAAVAKNKIPPHQSTGTRRPAGRR